MNPLTFVTHPSVRIKGTENNYTPTLCQEAVCSIKNTHMHCPFCVKAESYQDPVILKAHYRVKHVDKGIEFAGLKVLRCCDHCDIVGVIKGEKKFKGAHWHCYKCRNGFNRRDEAVKHYKTHFRNPQTTFQIQIAQEVNQTNNASEITHQPHSICSDEAIIHPALTQAACLATSEQNVLTSNGVCKTTDGTLQVSIAANETINTADGQTIMIISEEQLEASGIENTFGTQVISAEDVSFLDPKQSLERKYESAEIRCQRLEEEKAQLKTELDQTKAQMEVQAEEIASYKRREQELLNQLQLTEQTNMQDLMASLQQQHKDLLTAQLSSLRQAFLSRLPQELLVGSTVVQVQPDTNEVLITEQNGRTVSAEVRQLTSAEIAQLKQEVSDQQNSVKAEPGSGVTETTGELVTPCLVMCVEDTETENVTEQSSLVIASEIVDGVSSVPGAVGDINQNGHGVTPADEEVHIVLEEVEEAVGGAEPARKKHKVA